MTENRFIYLSIFQGENILFFYQSKKHFLWNLEIDVFSFKKYVTRLSMSLIEFIYV